ncbi:MAG TPA: UDP-3-O-acyl-N-acetylglucosamine deacetylase [Myxococcota bacterium]|nr:UDP-3-O-acyl-N-acetylglucosamine deacetylase [Myxococcota bacterium]HND29895.1 UDP-3-O-acyl-N-acetylglucosamine deacetylase [Myxococcota bacterium]
MRSQQTLARSFVVEGRGLHSGAAVRLTARPAPEHSGLVYVVGGHRVPARVAHVTNTQLATTLGLGEQRVSMVEHLGAALYTAGVDNLEIEVEGGEVPVLDGTAQPWVEAIRQAGLESQSAAVRVLRIQKKVTVEAGESWISAEPADRLHLSMGVAFAHPAIGTQHWAGGPADFAAELSWARTLGFFADAEKLRALGLARGAGLDNTLVFGDDGPMNEGGLRAPDEVVRHKALDFFGDLSLVGAPVLGHFRAWRSGHSLHLALLRRLVEEGAYEAT